MVKTKFNSISEYLINSTNKQLTVCNFKPRKQHYNAISKTDNSMGNSHVFAKITIHAEAKQAFPWLLQKDKRST